MATRYKCNNCNTEFGVSSENDYDGDDGMSCPNCGRDEVAFLQQSQNINVSW